MNKKQKILQKVLGAAAVVFVALAASSCSNSTSGGNSQKTSEKKKIPALSVRSANYERNEGIILPIGSYTAVPAIMRQQLKTPILSSLIHPDLIQGV